MGSVGDDHLVAGLAALAMIRADHQQPRQLALRAGGRMQRHGVHAGDLGERGFHSRDQFERALRQMRRRRGMESRKAGQSRQLVVHDRVVLHRARAERVELERLGEVELGEAQKMPQHLRLAELGEAGEILAAKLGADQLGAAALAGGAWREISSAAAFG